MTQDPAADWWRERKQDRYPRCDACRCGWHGLPCRTTGCDCTSSINERKTA